MKNVQMEGTSDIRELKVLGDWAYLRNYLTVTITPPGGEPVRRSGYTLTILLLLWQTLAKTTDRTIGDMQKGAFACIQHLKNYSSQLTLQLFTIVTLKHRISLYETPRR